MDSQESRTADRAPFFLLWLILLLAFAAQGQDQKQKDFYLPTNPKAAAYILSRLSDKELIDAPRSEFVYIALLERKGIPRQHKIEALHGLSTLHGSTPVVEILGALQRLDEKEKEGEPVLRELFPILLGRQPSELASHRPALVALASQSKLALTRQIAFAAIINADQGFERAWAMGTSAHQNLTNVVLAVPLIPAAKIRAALSERIELLVHESKDLALRQAAIRVLPSIPGRETANFKTLASLLTSGVERNSAVASLRQIPKQAWPKQEIAPLAETLLRYLSSVPPTSRTEAAFSEASQFVSELASVLPPAESSAVQKALRNFGVQVLVLRTLYEKMLFDKQLLVVEAGKPVEILFENDDAMQHNLVITAPGALEEVGSAAEKMPAVPDASGRVYVPDSPKVLQATALLNPLEKTRLTFVAPLEVGDYPFVCTYPGHWRLMNGVMVVVKDVDSYLLTEAARAPRKMTEWKVSDLAPEIGSIDSGPRNLSRGKELFTTLACAQCHKLGSEGYPYGPDLTDSFTRWNHDAVKVLQQILEPSEVIEERYRNYSIATRDGESYSGLIVKSDPDNLTIQLGPSDALLKNIPQGEISAREAQKSSLMPMGLLNSLSKEDIFDLLAFLKKAGAAGSEKKNK